MINKALMKKLLLYSVLLIFAASSTAQIVIEPDSLVASGSADSEAIEAVFSVTNQSDAVNMFWWQLVKNDFPKEWKTQVCDANNCYIDNFDICPAGLPNHLIIDSTYTGFSIKVKPHGVGGNTLMYFKMYTDSDLTNEVYSLPVYISTATSLSDKITDRNLAIYPNPCLDKFMLKNTKGLDKIEIYNIAGKKMKTMDVVHGMEYEVGDLSSGLYIVRFLDKKEKVVDVQRLSKR
jgi:hypothetical protein